MSIEYNIKSLVDHILDSEQDDFYEWIYQEEYVDEETGILKGEEYKEHPYYHALVIAYEKFNCPSPLNTIKEELNKTL